MGPISSLFVDFGIWNWVIFGTVLFILEAFVPGVFLIWFGIAAMLTGVLAYLLDMTWQFQLLTFVSFAVLSVLVAWKFVGYGFGGGEGSSGLNNRAERYIGQEFVVEEAIRNGRGKIRLGDSLWPVRGEDMEKGARVRVTGVAGNALVVEAV